MEVIFCILLLLIFFLLYVLLRSFNKNIFITIVCTLLIINIIISPKLCIDSALVGALLFFKKVFPSLFPFLVLTGIMMNYDGVKIYSKLFGSSLCRPLRLSEQCTFVIIVSILCGYPLGAKYASDLYEEGAIDFSTFQRLVNIASNTSPLFAIGAVGTSMLSSSYIGYLLLISNYISCFIIGFIIPGKSVRVTASKGDTYKLNSINIGKCIKQSIENSINSCLSIGGYVVLFNVITNIIKSNILFDIAVKKIGYLTGMQNELISGALLGIVEMTNGCNLISISDVSMNIKVITISFLLGFSGFSIISQVHSFTYKHKLSMKKYILRKILQGFIAALISMIIFKIQFFNIAEQTFNSTSNTNLNLIFISCIILLIITYIYGKLKILFHTS